jgi:hypothetical protein
MAVVIAAKRTSPIPSLVGWSFPDCRRGVGEGDGARDPERRIGRHLRTASTEARHGWTWRGYENITRMTMAALPMVEATDGASVVVNI